MRFVSDVADRLVELGVAALHEALGRQHLLGGVRLLVGDPFAGPALTVGLPAGDNLGLHVALEQAESGSVVCAESTGGGLYGVVGEILVEAERARGIAGFVLDDGVRDSDRLTPPPSIAGRGVSARGTVKRRIRRPVGSPVALGGELVAAGDWLVCDYDGACVVPKTVVQDVVDRAVSRLTAEKQIRDEVARGLTTRAVLRLPINPPASID